MEATEDLDAGHMFSLDPSVCTVGVFGGGCYGLLRDFQCMKSSWPVWQNVINYGRNDKMVGRLVWGHISSLSIWPSWEEREEANDGRAQQQVVET